MASCCGDIFVPIILDCSGNMRSITGSERIRLGEQLLGLKFAYTDKSTTLETNLTVLADPTSGNITLELPPISLGSQMVVKNVGAANSVTVSGAGSDTIDGAATKELTSQYETLRLVCDRNEWWVV